MLDTGCAGVMVSRAAVGQPWLLGKLQAQLKQEHFAEPDITEIGEILIRHTHQLALLLESEKFAVFQARKFAKYYARRLTSKSLFSHDVNLCSTIAEMVDLVSQYFHITAR